MIFEQQSIELNKNGKLSEEQMNKISSIISARSCTLWIIIICFGFMFFLSFFALPDFYQKQLPAFYVILGFDLLYLISVFFTIKSLKINKKNKSNLRENKVETVTGQALKIYYNTPVALPNSGSATHAYIRGSAGWLEINKEKYGAIDRNLFQQVDPSIIGKYYYTKIEGYGFGKKIVVNFDY